MPDRDRVTIERKLERYLIGVIEDTSSTRKERADAARQLVQLRTDKTQRIQEAKARKPASNVLGMMPGRG
mgnify:CR=1 FL=1